MRHLLAAACSLLVMLAYGCASEPQLRPAKEANLAKGVDDGAVASEAGVSLEAQVNAWRWTPEHLNEELTPVLVRIENNSDVPLRVRYEEFQLVTTRGIVYAALPPFDIRGKVTERIDTYAYPASGFFVAPHLHGYYSGLGAYDSPFFYDTYYSTYYPVYAQYELPTGEMLVRALPEGVIEPGGRIAGFIYFADIESIEPIPGKVKLRYVLVDAESRERFGVIEIPFDVVED